MKKVFLAMAAAAMLFVGCSKDDNAKIQGKWILSEMAGEAMPTNMKIVYTFGENSRGYESLSADQADLWMDRNEFSYTINGDVLSLVMDQEAEIHPDHNFKVKSIDGNSMVLIASVKDMPESEIEEVEIKLTRVIRDYSTAILGTWEGRSTNTEGSEFDDGENHRWEYLSNGTFRYYHRVAGVWQLSNDEYANYFVDGNLLCTRWKNNGIGTEEHREWWEITNIEDGVMTWKALRQRENDETYTATFRMEKVQ